jgi:hypothetical protein
MLEDLSPGHECEPAVVDEKVRREHEQEDEAETAQEDDEDVLLLGDSPD